MESGLAVRHKLLPIRADDTPSTFSERVVSDDLSHLVRRDPALAVDLRVDLGASRPAIRLDDERVESAGGNLDRLARHDTQVDFELRRPFGGARDRAARGPALADEVVDAPVLIAGRRYAVTPVALVAQQIGDHSVVVQDLHIGDLRDRLR